MAMAAIRVEIGARAGIQVSGAADILLVFNPDSVGRGALGLVIGDPEEPGKAPIVELVEPVMIGRCLVEVAGFRPDG